MKTSEVKNLCTRLLMRMLATGSGKNKENNLTCRRYGCTHFSLGLGAFHIDISLF